MRNLLSLALLALVSTTALFACAVDDANPADEGDGTEDALRQQQYQGRELPSKTLSLTFDDGPGERTGELADYLKDQGIPAAFFMMGKNAVGKDSLLSRVVADGHVIGNHTWDHQQLTALSNASAISEVERADRVLSPFYSGGMHMFRAPYGAWSGRISTALNGTEQKNYVGSIFWDIGGDMANGFSADWACWGAAKKSVEGCGAGYLKEITTRGHGVVLMHDIHSKTVDMVKWLVPQLKAQGYTFVRVDTVPQINADLRAAGATPPPSLPLTKTKNASECTKDGVMCGARIGREAGSLFKCENGKIQTVCVCSDACAAVGTVDQCTCRDGT